MTAPAAQPGTTRSRKRRIRKRRFLPSSIGLTVLLAAGCHGDRGAHLLGRLPHGTAAARRHPASRRGRSEQGEDGKPKSKRAAAGRLGSDAAGDRSSGSSSQRAAAAPIVVPESAAPQRRGGGLVLETHARLFTYPTPDGRRSRCAPSRSSSSIGARRFIASMPM